MKKTMIIDTNVLIHAHDAILKLDDNDVVLPMTVIEESTVSRKDRAKSLTLPERR